MRTRFTVSHDLSLKKSYGKKEAKLTFKIETSQDPYKYKEIEITLHESDVRRLIVECGGYLEKVVEEAKSDIRSIRKAFNYSNSEPKITYDNQ